MEIINYYAIIYCYIIIIIIIIRVEISPKWREVSKADSHISEKEASISDTAKAVTETWQLCSPESD